MHFLIPVYPGRFLEAVKKHILILNSENVRFLFKKAAENATNGGSPSGLRRYRREGKE